MTKKTRYLKTLLIGNIVIILAITFNWTTQTFGNSAGFYEVLYLLAVLVFNGIVIYTYLQERLGKRNNQKADVATNKPIRIDPAQIVKDEENDKIINDFLGRIK